MNKNVMELISEEKIYPIVRSKDSQKAIDESSPDVTEVSEGKVLNDTPDTSDSSGSGYMEMGKVYIFQNRKIGLDNLYR